MFPGLEERGISYHLQPLLTFVKSRQNIRDKNGFAMEGGTVHRSVPVYPAAWADRGKALEPHAHVGRKHTRRLPLGASQHCPLTRRGHSRRATLGH